MASRTRVRTRYNNVRLIAKEEELVEDFYLAVGDSVSFSKTVGESDVYLFAGISGDFSPNHIDEEVMKATPYGRRIAHGALLVGYMFTV